MYGKQRAAEIGYENVFDYSLGNPSVPCPDKFTKAMQTLLAQEEPVASTATAPVRRPGLPHRRGGPSGKDLRPAL